MTTAPFWKSKTLQQMSKAEWESLCDGCAKCCLHKIEDIDSGDLYFTNIVCFLLDLDTCRCGDYEHRRELVPDCVNVYEHGDVQSLNYMPSTCAYRLLANGDDLPDWHPLVSGDPESVHRAGQSVRGRVFVESEDLVVEDHIVEWPR
ncbi:YcgN family cysteine cluster protein [Kaarinaea lacus]